MRIIPKQNLVGYWPLDGHALDMSRYSNLTPGLVAYYQFNSGALTTDSVSSNTLTNVNTVGETASGKIGYGADFGSANTNKYFKRDSNFGITDNNSKKSFSGWLRVDGQPSGARENVIFQYSANNGNTAQSQMILFEYYEAAGVFYIYLYFAGGTAGAASKAYTLTTGTYYHLAVVYNQTDVRLYINGTLELTNSRNGTGNVTTYDGMSIGAIANNGINPTHYHRGIIDEVGVWSRDLSGAEVSNLYNATAGLAFPLTTPNNGTVTGALPVPSQNPAIPASLAYKFNGTSDYIKTSTMDASVAGNNPRTLMCWVKFAAFNADNYIAVAGGSAGANHFCINYYNTAGYYLRLVNGTDISTNKQLSLNRWYHITATHNGTYSAIYLDGKLLGTGNATLATTQTSINIGVSTVLTYGFTNGNIQEVAIFNKALSAQEIQAIYNQSRRKYRSSPSSTITQIITTFIKKLNGVSYAGIKKVNGVAIASIKKILGLT